MKLSNNILIGIFSLCLLTYLSGCTVKKPEMPTWETTWDLPLISSTESIDYLIDELDEEDITFDSLGNPVFIITESIDTTFVGDNLNYNIQTTESFDTTLGAVTIEVIEPQLLDLDIENLGIPVLADSIPVDTSLFSYHNLPEFHEFTWVYIDQGLLQIQITNDLGFDLDSLAIAVFNASDTTSSLGIVTFDNGLDQGETKTDSLDLLGDSLTNCLTLLISERVLPQPIEGGSNSLNIICSFPDGITVTRAQTEVPRIEYTFGGEIALEDTTFEELFIEEAVIDTGRLTLNIINRTNLSCSLHINLPQFTIGDDTLTMDYIVDSLSTLNEQVVLGDYVIKPEGTDSQYVNLNIHAIIDSTAPNQIVVNSADSLIVTASLSQISFSSAIGIIKPDDVILEPTVQEIKVPQGLEDAQLTHATIDLRVFNNSNARAYIDFLITADTDSQIVVQDTIYGKAAIPDPPKITVIHIDSIVTRSFLNPPPTEVTVTGSIVFNPDIQSITIASTDYIFSEIEIYSPLAFAINDTVDIEVEINETDVNSEDLPDFEETFVYAKIDIELTNYLPVGTRVAIYISSTINDSTIFDDGSDAVVIGPFTLESGQTDSQGYISEAVISVFEDSLDSNEILVFDNETIYVAPKVELLPTSGSIFRGSDYIKIKADARLMVRAGEHLWEDE